MIAESVRRATRNASGDVDVELHKRISAKMQCWASDGADRGVGDAATKHYPSMVFTGWEESHSVVRLLAPAIQADPEAAIVDSLLVLGKKRYSLAKLVST